MSTEKIDVEAAMSAVQQVNKTVAALRARRQEIEDELKRLEDENEALYSQPLSRKDAKALALGAIDHWGQEFLASWLPVLSDFTHPKTSRSSSPSKAPVNFRDYEEACEGKFTRVFAASDQAAAFSIIDPHRNIVVGVLNRNVQLQIGENQSQAIKSSCFFFGDQIKAKIVEHFDANCALPIEPNALPVEERQKIIGANKNQIKTLSEEAASIEGQLDQMRREIEG